MGKVTKDVEYLKTFSPHSFHVDFTFYLTLAYSLFCHFLFGNGTSNISMSSICN
jgi:hypothetical protein